MNSPGPLELDSVFLIMQPQLIDVGAAELLTSPHQLPVQLLG
jgi:hypothetical protein